MFSACVVHLLADVNEPLTAVMDIRLSIIFLKMPFCTE